MDAPVKKETIVFGGGCFWCTEAVFSMIRGVESVTPGYAGGDTDNPTYEEVCSGTTNHVEVVKIVYDATHVSVRDLLTVFFGSHDPTTLNRQGADIGTQYRSAVFFTTEDQKRAAEEIIKEINESSRDGDAVVTEVLPLPQFFEAEGYHKEYYKKNDAQPYCAVVINPKLKKVQKQFANLLKEIHEQ